MYAQPLSGVLEAPAPGLTGVINRPGLLPNLGGTGSVLNKGPCENGCEQPRAKGRGTRWVPNSPHPHLSPHLRCVTPGPGSVHPSPRRASRESAAASGAARRGFQQPRRRGLELAPPNANRVPLKPWESLLSGDAFPAGTAAAAVPRDNSNPLCPISV